MNSNISCCLISLSLLHSLTHYFSLLDVLYQHNFCFLHPSNPLALFPIMILLDRDKFILFSLHPQNKPRVKFTFPSKTNKQKPDLSLKYMKWP